MSLGEALESASLSSEESRTESEAGTDDAEEEDVGEGREGSRSAEILSRRSCASSLVIRVPINTSQCTKYG